MRQFWTELYDQWEKVPRAHHGHAFNSAHLLEIEQCLPERVSASAETGCGKSTIVLSNISDVHHIFALDDRNAGPKSSILFFENCPITRLDRVKYHLGFTQEILAKYEHDTQYDIVLIDGPHGYPFPELEYYFFYPYIRPNGLLIVDDVHIPTIGRFADILAEDEMFELVSIVRTTAIFRRTAALTFDPKGDGWWTQRYNRRRISPQREFFLPSESVNDLVSSQKLDLVLHGEFSGPADGQTTPGLQSKYEALRAAYQASSRQLFEATAKQSELEIAKLNAEAELREQSATLLTLKERQNQWRGIAKLALRKARGKQN